MVLWVHPPTSLCPALSAHAEPFQRTLLEVTLCKSLMSSTDGYIQEHFKVKALEAENEL